MLSVDSIDLPVYLTEKLRVNGYKNIKRIVTSSPLLMMSQDFHNAEIQLVSSALAKKLTPKCQTALEMFYSQNDVDTLVNMKYVSTGCSVLDNALNGGIDLRSVTEIVGVSGVGKTQFCFNCCVETVLSKSGSVIFIDTELKFDPLRLSNLLEYQVAHRGLLATDTSVENLLGRVKVCIIINHYKMYFLSFKKPQTIECSR